MVRAAELSDAGVCVIPPDMLTQTTTHGETGLTAMCLDASRSHTHEAVRTAVLAYVLDRVPDRRTACLAGSTVHMDKTFLVREMPELIEHLHYRIVDVSSIKELVRRWYSEDHLWKGTAATRHRALDDIRASMAGACVNLCLP